MPEPTCPIEFLIAFEDKTWGTKIIQVPAEIAKNKFLVEFGDSDPDLYNERAIQAWINEHIDEYCETDVVLVAIYNLST